MTRGISVVGRSLSALVAVRRLRQSELSVEWLRPKSGTLLSLWGGLGQAFGPSQPHLPDSAGAVEQRVPSTPNFDPSLEGRWRRLIDRRGDLHPYRRFGLDQDDVARHLKTALDLIEDLGLVDVDGARVVPGPQGNPFAADVAADSVRRAGFQPDARVLVVDTPAVETYRAGRVAHRLDESDALEVQTWTGPPFDSLGTAPNHPVHAARALEKRVTSQDAAAFGALADRCREDATDIALLPPCMGATLEGNRTIMERLHEALPCQVAEMPATRDSVHGWRLDRALREKEGDDVDVQPEDVSSASACILATGGFFDGGLPGSAPLVEPLTGAPLWLDGSPVPEADEVFLPNLLEARPWDDHRLFRAGLAVDRRARVLGRDGAPVRDRLYAAGRLLSGFNPLHDGCAMGVELASGLVAAESIINRAEAGI